MFTAYVWGLLVVTLTPLWALLAVLPAGPAAAWTVGAWARLILRLGGCRVRIEGLHHLERSVPAIVVVNHTSYLDAIAVLAAMPMPFRFVVNHQAADWPLVGLAIRKSRHLVVNRGRIMDRGLCALAMLDTLRRGTPVVVFPEGTFSRDGRLLPFHPGAFRVAGEAQCAVVPAALRGTRFVLQQGVGYVRRGPITLAFGEPLQAVSTLKDEVARLRDRAREDIEARMSGPSGRLMKGGEVS